MTVGRCTGPTGGRGFRSKANRRRAGCACAQISRPSARRGRRSWRSGTSGRQDVLAVLGEPGAVRFGLGNPDAEGQMQWRTAVTAFRSAVAEDGRGPRGPGEPGVLRADQPALRLVVLPAGAERPPVTVSRGRSPSVGPRRVVGRSPARSASCAARWGAVARSCGARPAERQGAPLPGAPDGIEPRGHGRSTDEVELHVVVPGPEGSGGSTAAKPWPPKTSSR